MKVERIGSVFRTQLDNGLTVVLKENHHTPVVAIQVWVEVGSGDENKGEGGMAHLHEHLLFKGTKTRGVGEIARAIEAAGGDINAWTSLDHTVYHLVLASRYLDLGLEVLADALGNASFDAEELEREKKVVLEEIKSTRDLPGRWIGDLLFATAYQTHPYRQAILGTAASVTKATRRDILRFFHKHYQPGRMTLLVVGDLEPKTVIQKIRRLYPFKSPASRRPSTPRRPKETAQHKPRVLLIKDDITEAHFSLGWHIPSAKGGDIPALEVLAVALGQGESSRFNLKMRHGLNLVNDVFAYAYSPKDPGLFVVGGSCRVEKLVPALKQLGSEISGVGLSPLPASELSKVKTMIESDALYQQETVEGNARRLGYYQVLMGDPSYGDTYLTRLQAVTPDEARKAAASHLGVGNLSLVVLLPEKAAGLDEAALRRALEEGYRGATVAMAAAEETEPEVVRKKLKNGPVILVQEDHTNALVSIRAVFLGGVRYEDETNNGINNFLAGMLTRGTTGRSASDIANEMDSIAGTIEGFSGRNTFGLLTECPSRYFDRAFELFADCLLHPSFSEDELKRERELILEEISSREDNLSGLAFDLFAATLFSSHPYRQPVLGTRQSVIGIRQPHLKEYLATYFTTNRMILSVVGDVDRQRVLKQARALFAPAQTQGKSSLPRVALDPRPTQTRTAIKYRSRAQAHLVLGFMGTTLASQDRYPLEVLMAILASQGGRLFVELRDRQSLAYSVSGFSLEGIEPGYVAIYLGVDPKRIQEAVSAVRDQLQRVIAGPVEIEELERAKQYLVGTQAISLQRNAARAAALAFNEIYGLGCLAHRRYPEHILAVTGEDVLSVARKYLDLKAYSLALVRPRTP